MRKTRLEREYAWHIMWLYRYFKKSKDNPLNPILLQMLEEREQAAGDLSETDIECKKYKAWFAAISHMINNTDKSIMTVIKTVYVSRHYSLTRAGMEYLHYGETKTQATVRQWFESLDREYHRQLLEVYCVH